MEGSTCDIKGETSHSLVSLADLSQVERSTVERFGDSRSRLPAAGSSAGERIVFERPFHTMFHKRLEYHKGSLRSKASRCFTPGTGRASLVLVSLTASNAPQHPISPWILGPFVAVRFERRSGRASLSRSIPA